MTGLLRKIIPWQLQILWYRNLYTNYLKNLKKKIVKKKKTVVFFNHFYSQDVKALAKEFKEKNFEVLNIDTSELFRCAKIFFDDGVQDLNAIYPDNSYSTKIFKDESSRILHIIKELYGINVLILPSDNYYWVREFVKLCKGKVPVIVVDKEGLISPYDFNAEATRIRKFAPPISDFYYVWSERQKDYWISTGLNENKILVSGQPRSDLLFKDIDKTAERNNKQLTFFTYDDGAYIPPKFIQMGFSWKNMKRDTHEVLLNFSKEFPDWNVTIKAHPQQTDLKELQIKYNRDNLDVIGGSKDSNYLIKTSDLVICFQSTVLLESLMMNIPVLYTYWAKMPPGLSQEILQFSDNLAVNVIKSKKDFKSKLFDLAKRNSFDEIVRDKQYINTNFITKFFSRVDGNVSKNIVEDIIKRFGL